MSKSSFIALIAALPLIGSTHAAVLRSVGEINGFLETQGEKTAYDVSGIVLSGQEDGAMVLEDKTGRMFVYGQKTLPKAQTGDLVRLQGHAYICSTSEPWVQVNTVEFLGKGKGAC